MIIFYIITIVLSITTIIVVSNYITAPILKISAGTNENYELISVLIPARNEELNILKCLRGIMSQDYKNIEVIVLDDESDDKTYFYASEAAVMDERIKVFKGDPLPANFTGKNWACHQLSRLAKGRYLLFIDADVELEKGSINSAVSAMKKDNLNLLSVFPSQKLDTPGEWFLVPLMNWLLLTFLPLRFVYSSASPSFAAANGQFMLFERTAYDRTGGHKTVGNVVTEDIEFVRLLKKHKYVVKTYLGGKLVHCRMYSNFIDSVRGFSKNFYPGFNLHPVNFLTLVISLIICYNAPLIMIFTSSVFIPLVLIICLQRILISVISKQNPGINVLFHPIQMIMLLVLGINSLVLSKRQKRVWKGRTF